jgi:hypothetical protein
VYFSAGSTKIEKNFLAFTVNKVLVCVEWHFRRSHRRDQQMEWDRVKRLGAKAVCKQRTVIRFKHLMNCSVIAAATCTTLHLLMSK